MTIELEMDNPTGKRGTETPAPDDAIELDMTTPGQTVCRVCEIPTSVGVDERGECLTCSAMRRHPHLAAIQTGWPETLPPTGELREADIVARMGDIITESTANAAVQGIGSMRGGQLRGVGFSTAEGYMMAINNGVPARTHAEYLTTLRTRFGKTSADLANLRGPMAETSAPVGAGVVHTPSGHSAGSVGIFERPRAERQFVVGQPSSGVKMDVNKLDTGAMVAGAAAEGSHAIFAWEGTSGVTRGRLVGDLESVGFGRFAPRALSARAQVGDALASLQASGMTIRAIRKSVGALDTGVYGWTVGVVEHINSVGSAYGKISARFTLTGEELTFDGDADMCGPIVAAYKRRLASEVYKSGDLTTWLGSLLRTEYRAVRFGALGWLVPARHAAAAKVLTEAVASAGFGHGWVHGLPVATTDQLRDGIVGGLMAEVQDVLDRCAKERDAAQTEYEDRMATHKATKSDLTRGRGDIGEKRAATFLGELRRIAERLAAYAQILGEEHVAPARLQIREAMESLEDVAGEDYSGIRERFALIWDEIERDQRGSL